ncbi:zinc finger BED domain-containing protein 1-like [Ctenocephalides felis]|uniref:zinc finger BED domain-containing protein 1-like n=1 Tax=Ctenocephalides felis TaxID=7515 RepID=UPI000E6E2A6F|nr:zinc finger BED domain-containing protein 1-like [Ctenocephalides felis]
MAMRRKTSTIWNHFSLKDNKAKCNYCADFLSILSSNTGNLIRHLKRKHPTISIYPAMRRETVLLDNMLALKTSEAGTSDSNPINTMKNNSNVISNYLQNTNPLSMRQIAEIDAQLIKMIAKEYHSMQIIEGTEFRMLLKLLNPRYNVPNRKTLAKTLLPQMYEKELNIVREKIAKTTSICLTTDAWTSITNDSYMAITAHYMGENGNLCVNLLCCVQYNERHTSINVSNFLRNELNKWN